MAACGREAFAESERQVLPDFAARKPEQGRFLLAPYALAHVEGKYLPLPKEELHASNQPYEDQLEAKLELFYASGVADALEALRTASPQCRLLHIETPRWQDYFAASANFPSVSFDGKQRYSVPQRETLQSFGVEADYAVVIGRIRFEKRGRPGNQVLDCYARFLVWAYAPARSVAEGEVSAHVFLDMRDNITRQDWARLGGQIPRGILLKPPFLNV
jgi:hypothetical protein